MRPGTLISRYRIISRLGSGGMGEVYLAHDPQLDRSVALKILHSGSSHTAERLRRFAHEARVVAALNHPGIAHIYEISEADGVPFLVMEYVEGETLSKMLQGRPISTEKLLDIGTQIADALDEAHSKGVTHRDIKPGNIMLTARGQVKLLDFGLAKIRTSATAQRAGVSSWSETDSGPITNSGAVIGTLRYMSPEQAQGEEADNRSDIFSLGAVLYEMAAGTQAFPGASSVVLIEEVINKTPVSPCDLNPNVPFDLERIIFKALEKDPGLRYQTASDLRADLKRVKRDLEAGGAPTAPGIRVRKRRFKLVLPLLGAAAAAVAAWFFYLNTTSGPPPAPLQAIPLTSFRGSESQASFSPDGSQVAFSWTGEGEVNWDIYVKVVEAGAPLRLTTSPAIDYSPAWSPDGRFIAFLRQSESEAAFLAIPALGGLERKLSDASPHRAGVDSPFIAWAPDGKTVALVDRADPRDPMEIYLLDVDSGSRRRLTEAPPKSLGDSNVTFSPDGKYIAFLRTQSLAIQDIYTVPVAGGEPTRITSDNRRIYGMAWNPGDGNILFASARAPGSRLWRVSPSNGTLQRIAGVGDGASFLAVTRSGNRLAYTRSTVDTNIWRYPMPGSGNPSREGKMLISSTRFEQGPKYSPDGRKIVFGSTRSGSWEVWVSDSEGLNANQLTFFNDSPTGSPAWSPDGRLIAFDSRKGGNPDIYVIPAEGGAPRRLTTAASEEVSPRWSRDGKWIYFASNRTGSYEIWKSPVEGGEEIRVTFQGGFHGVESPDGKWFYYAKSLRQPGLWRLPLAGGTEEPVMETLGGGYWGYWALHGDGVYYVRQEEAEGEGIKYSFRFFNLKTRQERMLMPFEKRPFNSGLSISPDGKWFLYTQADQTDTDIMLVDNFR